MELHKKLKSLREERRYSQEYMALQLGISQNAYSRIELGITKISIERLKSLSKILGISIHQLIQPGEEAKSGESFRVSVNVQENELYERIIREKEEVIAILREQNQSMRRLLDRLQAEEQSKAASNHTKEA
jgi:transcriptional regulator with XRE-family HTH domain